LNNGNFTAVKTRNSSVFAYIYEYNKKSVLTIGNLDFKNSQNVKFNIPGVTNKSVIFPVKISEMPIIENGKFSAKLSAGEIMVFIIKNGVK